MTLKAGDVISFVCKDGSFGMAKLLRIDTFDDLPVPEPLYHFSIYSLRNVFPPNAAHLSDAKTFIPHLPILESGAKRSGATFVAFEEVSPKELEAYAIWKEAFFAGEAGVFDLTIDEAIALMLEALGNEKT
ncbi:MAG: hypothetical protein NZM06_09595 [Chloroherpetonaceae bacterium]|nr:hypothetical protein [Chloroherpetonaceae bacterium]MDW8438032.1 hypothetical protein [Chloroherpetonaceae bacterium]